MFPKDLVCPLILFWVSSTEVWKEKKNVLNLKAPVICIKKVLSYMLKAKMQMSVC